MSTNGSRGSLGWISSTLKALSRPLRPATLKGLEYDLRAFASALVRRGRQPADLVSISACLTLENYKEGLRFFHERLGKSTRVAQLADGMKAIAKHWVKVDSEVLGQMERSRAAWQSSRPA